MLRAFTLALLVVSSSATAAAQEGPLEAAMEAYRDGELYRALELFTSALEAPGNTPADLVTIHLHLGILHGSLADLDAARREFRAALAIDADTPAPDELNPTLREIFDSEAAERGGRSVGLEVQAREPLRSDRALVLDVRLVGAPQGLVDRIEGRAAGDLRAEVVSSSATTGTLTFPVAAWGGGESAEVQTRALDAFGGVVAATTDRLSAAPAIATPVAADETPAVDDDDDGGILASPWLWTIVAVVVLGGAAAVTAVLLTRETQPVVGAPIIMELTR